MESVAFHEPVYVGDLVSFRTRTSRVGRTSVRVHVTVEAIRYTDNAAVMVTEAEVVYVNVDEERRPLPIAGTPP
jgi:acyl-CoA thioesterase YciA